MCFAFEMYDCVAKPEDMLGIVAFSRQGRDKGLMCFVVGVDDMVSDSWFVIVADGRLHKAGKPKRKNIKHLKFTRYRLVEIHEIMSGANTETDRKLREGLTAFGSKFEEGRMYGKRRCN